MVKQIGYAMFSLALAAAFSQPAYAAACRSDQKLGLIGSVKTDDAVVSSSGHEVRLINVTCTSTACVAGLYDGTLLSDAVAANLRLEPGAVASTTVLVPSSGFFEQPLTFQNGIVFVDDGNVAAIALYECTQR